MKQEFSGQPGPTSGASSNEAGIFRPTRSNVGGKFIGARHSLGKNSNKWVLISRVPFPGDEVAEKDEEEEEELPPSSAN
jgi:hypothetical protein